MNTFNEIDAARFLFDHPAFKHGAYNRFYNPGNDWVREHWTQATLQAMIATGPFFEPEAFARKLYEYPVWGYKQPWGVNDRVCAPWRKAISDLMIEVAA